MAQATFEFDENTQSALDELMSFFKVKNRSQAIRSAIALANAVAPATKGQTLVVRDQNNNGADIKIVITR